MRYLYWKFCAKEKGDNLLTLNLKVRKMKIKSNLKIVLTVLVLLSITVLSHAQELKLLEFRADMSMTDAVRFPKEDLNGGRCGLIRLGLVLPEATFEGDIISSEYKDGEWWIYMINSANWLTIKSPRHVPLRCVLEPTIKSNVTYIMTVVEITGSGGKPKPTHQYLTFQVTPSNASLEVNGQIWELSSDGSAMKFVSFGNYSYRILAQNYHPVSGNVRVNDPENTHKIKVDLKPNFGWIEVAGDGDLRDATVYIDNTLVGKAPLKSKSLKSGQHNVRISKELYETYDETVMVSDEQTTKLTPKLKPNYAEVTLKVDATAEIWVNKERKGIRQWKGKLEYGTYQIECRMLNHETSMSTHEITSKSSGELIELTPPIPICGSLSVESTPSFAHVFVDGKEFGETPRFISEILIGSHEVRLSKEGYYDHVETVVIQKNEQTEMKVILDDEREVRFVCNAPKAVLEIDGKNEGGITGTHRMKDGIHKIGVKAKGYDDYEVSILVSADKTVFDVNMQKKIKERFTFISLNGAYSVAPQLSYGISFGNVKRVGWFVSMMSNGDFTGFSAKESCDAEGFLSDGTLPNYSGETATGRNSIIIGGLVRVSKPLYLRVGAGYGMRSLCWKTVDGSNYRNIAQSVQGVDLSAGVQAHFGSFMISAEAVTTHFKTLEGKVGLGVAF